MSVSVYNLSVTLSGVERPGPRWQQLAEDWLVQLPDRHRGEGCAHEREKERGVNGVEWTVFVCVWFRVQYMCTCWVALSSLRLSAGSVGFGADCDVTADPPPCVSISLYLCVPVSLRAGWWRTFRSVVEASWGSWASGAAWAWEMPPWSEILVVSLAYTDIKTVVLL